MRVHSVLGPGLLEHAYAVCLAHELSRRGAKVSRQIPLPAVYDGIQVEAGYRIDLIVEEALIVEVKAVEKLLPIHTAQLLSYLKLAKVRLGLLFNFNVMHLKDGIKRVVNG
jgi:GxxExxY protein